VASSVKERSCRNALDHSRHLRERSRRKKNTATLNERTSVLAASLSDVSDGSDTNFTYILSVNELLLLLLLLLSTFVKRWIVNSTTL